MLSTIQRCSLHVIRYSMQIRRLFRLYLSASTASCNCRSAYDCLRLAIYDWEQQVMCVRGRYCCDPYGSLTGDMGYVRHPSCAVLLGEGRSWCTGIGRPPEPLPAQSRFPAIGEYLLCCPSLCCNTESFTMRKMREDDTLGLDWHCSIAYCTVLR